MSLEEKTTLGHSLFTKYRVLKENSIHNYCIISGTIYVMVQKNSFHKTIAHMIGIDYAMLDLPQGTKCYRRTCFTSTVQSVEQSVLLLRLRLLLT